MSYRVGYVLISKDIFALTVKMPEFKEVMHSWWIWGHLQWQMSMEISLGRGSQVPGNHAWYAS